MRFAAELPRRSLVRAAVWIVLFCPMALAQNNAAPGAASPPSATANQAHAPAFEVATIKPHSPAARISFMGVAPTPEGMNAAVATLPMLVQYAYGLLTVDQVSGAPDWAKDATFDIQAKMSEADLVEVQKLSRTDGQARRRLMMQALLADRFKLKVHSAIKQVPVFELVVAKGGSKLIDAATDTNPDLKKGEDGKPLTGYFHFGKDTSVAQGEAMKSLADFLSQPVTGVGRRVLDKTGLSSTYDFKLNWSIYSSGVGVRNGVAMDSPAEDAPSIFRALGEVGLKLQPATGAVETIVIDHAERASED